MYEQVPREASAHLIHIGNSKVVLTWLYLQTSDQERDKRSDNDHTKSMFYQRECSTTHTRHNLTVKKIDSSWKVWSKLYDLRDVTMATGTTIPL